METKVGVIEMVVFKFKYSNEFRVYKQGTDVDDVREAGMKQDSCKVANKAETKKVLNQFKKCYFRNINDTQEFETKNFNFKKVYYGNKDSNIVIAEIK